MIVLEHFGGLRDKGKREVGIEIEMEGRGLDLGAINYWDITRDGSLRGEAVEYVLKQPSLRNRFKSRLDYLQRELKKNESRLEPSDRCGVHIHVNCQHMQVEEVFRFITLYYIFENLLVAWCGEDREGNLFCLRATDAEFLIPSIIRCKKQHSFRNVSNDTFRYAALNLSALSKYGSLEFRAMRSPEDFSSIETWANLLLRLKDKSLEAKSAVSFISDMSMDGCQAFAESIFGELLPDLQHPDLESKMMMGVRLAQHLAYSPLGKEKNSPKIKIRRGAPDDVERPEPPAFRIRDFEPNRN